MCKITPAMTLLILPIFLYSGELTIHLNDGTSQTFEIREIDMITFSETYNNLFEMCVVPAGIYTSGPGDTIKTIDYDYQIMKYEVTNQQYVDYLGEALNTGDITVTTSTVEGYYPGDQHYSAGTYEFLDLDDSDCRIDWDGSNFTIISDYEDHPVVEVTWFGTWAFAEHYDLRLPTEQEWEKAARNSTGWNYPWGNSIDGSRANYWLSGDPWDNGTTPVGFYDGQNYQGFQTIDSPSNYAAYDMAGNVWEWTNSWSGGDFPNYRVLHSGGWGSNISCLQSWFRIGMIPNESNYLYGFRCVRR